MKLQTILVVAFVLACRLVTQAATEFPKIEQGDIVPHDNRLTKPIDKSKADELTIVSFNVRNWGTRPRSLAHFEVLADLVDEADVAVFQEVGLGLLDKDEDISDKEGKRLDAIEALLRINLGEGWNIVRSPKSTDANVSSSNEVGLVAYKVKCNGYTASLTWEEFVDLGELRDMAVFKLTLTKSDESREILLGSVHLKPEEPERVAQMDKVADWILARPPDVQVIVMGDFNWGYPTKSPTHSAERRIIELHDSGLLFMLFRHISYLKKASATQLRTNLGARKEGHFYDQFLMSSSLAGELADGGELLKDCGIISLEKRLKEPVKKYTKLRTYGLGRYLKHAEIDLESDADAKTAHDKAAKNVAGLAVNDASFLISDHRPIWVQLKVW